MNAWLSKDTQLVPGAGLFRSERRFSVWANTVSHSQLLLRSRTPIIDGRRQSRFDVLFKPVKAMKTRMDYEGLVIRSATADERDRVLDETGFAERPLPVFVLVTGDGLDYVVAQAVGWQEDEEEDRDPSDLAFFVGATDPTLLLPTDFLAEARIRGRRMRLADGRTGGSDQPSGPNADGVAARHIGPLPRLVVLVEAIVRQSGPFGPSVERVAASRVVGEDVHPGFGVQDGQVGCAAKDCQVRVTAAVFGGHPER